MDRMQNGFWSGTMATSAMTLVMLLGKLDQPEALPPAKLTDDLVPEVLTPADSNRRTDLTMLAHFGFGVSLAAAYALMNGRTQEKNLGVSLAKGTAFGLAVWATSYLGWIPALGLRPDAHKLPRDTNWLMVAAHAVWGATLGLANHSLRVSGNIQLDGQNG